MNLINCINGDILYYQISKDDTLNNILTKFNIKTNNIIRNNSNIDFYEGEVIKIVRNIGVKHIVKPMENLSSIANKYGVDIQTIINDNNLTSKRLFVGQSLKISVS